MMLDGSWSSEGNWEGIGAGAVQIGDISAEVPADVKAEAQALADAIASGAYHPFTGPLNKQDGSIWLAAGEVADDGALSGLNFFVEGISAQMPQ
jgi:simple sugar transport system substrate-binding protein